MQAISKPQPLDLHRVDLANIGDADRSERLYHLLVEQVRLPFDLGLGPSVRATLFRTGQSRHVLLLVLHQAICDEWSVELIFHEAGALYDSYTAGQTSNLEELPIQHADFAVWQRDWLFGPVLEDLLAYWKRQLADLPLLRLPTDRPRPAVPTFEGSSHRFSVPQEIAEQHNILSRSCDSTFFMTLVAAFNALIHHYTGQDDIVIGAPIANRTRAEIEKLVGFFANTLVLRTDCSGDPTFRELLARVREVALGAYAHQDLPFEQLVEQLEPEPSVSHNPLFQVALEVQNIPRSGLTVTPLSATNRTLKFDLFLLVVEKPEGLFCTFEYSTDLFDALEGIAANPEQRLSQLPLLSDDERKQLLVDWNDSRIDYPLDLCLHQFIEPR